MVKAVHTSAEGVTAGERIEKGHAFAGSGRGVVSTVSKGYGKAKKAPAFSEAGVGCTSEAVVTVGMRSSCQAWS